MRMSVLGWRNRGTSRYWRWLAASPYIAAILVMMTSFTPIGARPAMASCSISDSSNGTNYIVVGAKQSPVSNLIGSSADLWNYDPAPVWGASAFWTMVWDRNIDWAQIGWEMAGADTQSRVFTQISNSSGYPLKWYQPNDTWTTSRSTAVHPTAPVKYEVYQSGGSWYAVYNYNSPYTLAVDWSPDEVKVAGETWHYQSAAGTDLGDHFPGDTSNKINANNSKKNVSGTWSDTSLSATSSAGNGSSDLSNGSGDGVRVWDVRCSS